MKTKLIGYWATTAILAFVLLSGGAAQLAHRPENVEGMAHLGYPLYFMTILGIWKLPGGIALLAPRFPLLKEWAYAGIFFELTGAAASHAVRGDGAAHIIWPLIFAGLAVASWGLRPQSRSLGVLFPPECVRRLVAQAGSWR
ncbi:MAG: DoxX family protein [Acidobacteriota bacterium]